MGGIRNESANLRKDSVGILRQKEEKSGENEKRKYRDESDSPVDFSDVLPLLCYSFVHFLSSFYRF